MDPAFAKRYANLYRNHWWWQAREAILTEVIARLGLQPPAEILDVGCGDGLFFPQLERFGNVRGIEIDESLLSADGAARPRIFTRPLGDPEYAGWKFDLITALDVIEHMEDDADAVRRMVSMLEPGGRLVVTVPAFMVLWDRHDEINHHYRRYTKQQLGGLLAPRGEVRELRYLFNGLFFPKLVVKLVGRMSGSRVSQDRLPPSPVNSVVGRYFKLENRYLGPLRLPFGTSVLAVLEKPTDEAAA